MFWNADRQPVFLTVCRVYEQVDDPNTGHWSRAGSVEGFIRQERAHLQAAAESKTKSKVSTVKHRSKNRQKHKAGTNTLNTRNRATTSYNKTEQKTGTKY